MEYQHQNKHDRGWRSAHTIAIKNQEIFGQQKIPYYSHFRQCTKKPIVLVKKWRHFSLHCITLHMCTCCCSGILLTCFSTTTLCLWMWFFHDSWDDSPDLWSQHCYFDLECYCTRLLFFCHDVAPLCQLAHIPFISVTWFETSQPALHSLLYVTASHHCHFGS